MREMRSAWKSICRRGMRNLLTVISIAIGVAALVLTGTVAQAGKQAVEDEMGMIAEHDIAGVAAWKLGYESGTGVWDSISRSLGK